MRTDRESAAMARTAADLAEGIVILAAMVGIVISMDAFAPALVAALGG